MSKHADTQENIHELLATRWSGRAFDPQKPVNREDIIRLLEAARWSPSCFNDQPWRILVFDKSHNPMQWESALGTLAEKNRKWARKAPLLILMIASEKFSHNEKPNRWAQYDCGAAAMSIALQANALGMTSHQMGGFDADLTKQTFNIPNDYEPMAMIAIGYPALLDSLPNEFQNAEKSQRGRRPIGEISFVGNWQKSFKA